MEHTSQQGYTAHEKLYCSYQPKEGKTLLTCAEYTLWLTLHYVKQAWVLRFHSAIHQSILCHVFTEGR